MKDTGLFDHLEFGITSKDARAMALSTRKLLELSFLALLDSGIQYRGCNVGCYMSGVAFDMLSVAEPVGDILLSLSYRLLIEILRMKWRHRDHSPECLL